VPTGIEQNCPTGSSDCLPVSAYDGIPTDPTFSVFGTAVGTILQIQPGLYGYETPIQNHLTSSAMVPIYGAAAAFHDTALEMFGRQDISEDRRRCKPTDDEEELWQLHRKVTLLYSVFWAMSELLTWKLPAGGAAAVLNPILEGWGIDPAICSEGGLFYENCRDVSTPWGLARTMIDEIHSFIQHDGWNNDGTMPNTTFNKVPYSDWRSDAYRYIPQNTPWKFTHKSKWQPLREHNDQGFMYHQEHVVPHIGETARSIFLGNEDICKRHLDDPNYDLPLESDLVLQRTRDLTEMQKVEIEYFDNKLASLFPLLVQQYVRMNVHLDSFEFIVADAANLHALREATIVVWKQKVSHDLVRPTTYIRHEMKGEEVFSYGGPNAGVVSLKAGEWQPYIRVMPHAEFPSGSSCLCRVFADTVVALTGSDDVIELIGGPLVDIRVAGSSNVEQGLPSESVTLSYNSWSEIVQRCGDTRLEGGMHYTASVPAGEEVCMDIGAIVVDAFKKLEAGEVPDYYMTNFSDIYVPSDGPRCPSSDGSDFPVTETAEETSLVTGCSDDDGDNYDLGTILAAVFGSLLCLSLIFILYLYKSFSAKLIDKSMLGNDIDENKSKLNASVGTFTEC